MAVEHLYFMDMEKGTLTRATLDGGKPEEIAGAWPDLRWIAVDDTYLYFTAGVAGGKLALVRTEKK